MPSVVVTDLLAAFSFTLSAVCVSELIGLFTSEVLSTLLSAKLIFAAAAVLAPVPPFVLLPKHLNECKIHVLTYATAYTIRFQAIRFGASRRAIDGWNR